MSLKYGVLGLLGYGDMTGYDINKYFNESVAFFWNAQQSQIYRELGILEKDGWVQSEVVYQTDKPNKKLYKINDTGREKLVDWLNNDKLDDLFISRNPFLLKLFFSAKLPRERVISILEKYKRECEAAADSIAAHTSDLFVYESHVDNSDESLYWKMTARYGIGHHRFNSIWAQECIDILKKGEAR